MNIVLPILQLSIYIILLVLLYYYNPYSIITNNFEFFIFITIFFTSFVLLYFLNSIYGNNNVFSNEFNIFKYSILFILGFGLLGYLIYRLVDTVNSVSTKSSMVQYAINILIVIVLLVMLYKLITTIILKYIDLDKHPGLALFYYIITYIPCLIWNLPNTIAILLKYLYFVYEEFGIHGKLKTLTYFLIFCVLVLLIVIPYIYSDYIVSYFNKFISLFVFGYNTGVDNIVGGYNTGVDNIVGGYNTGTTNIVNQTNQIGHYDFLSIGSNIMNYIKYYFNIGITPSTYKQVIINPIGLSNLQTISTYHSLNNNNDNFQYQYGLSLWFMINNSSPSYNVSNNKYTSILSYGDKPNILYKGSTNTLKITENDETVYETNKILLQKWNQLVINYDGGTLDIFLNNTLLKTKQNVVPYMTYDALTTGSPNGIDGEICNVTYSTAPFTLNQINNLYKNYKHKNPPI